MDYKKQIEEILAKTENKEIPEQMRNLATGFSVFYLTLLDQGISKEQALELTKEYLIAMVHNISPQNKP